jgi:RNA polymerase sigma-70 factor (ECF subfamily)
MSYQPDSEHSRRHASYIEDSALICSCQDGCMECFAILFNRYCKLVFSIAWRLLRQKDEVEDLVQEVFLSIFLQRNRYDPTRGPVRTWIGQFAQFKALNRRRLISKRRQLPLEEAREFEALVNPSIAANTAIERQLLVGECLASLNPNQRRILEAIHFEGYTLREAADLLNESLANTRNLYYRGMKTIRLHVNEMQHPQKQSIKSIPSEGMGPTHLMEQPSYLGTEI